MKYDVEDLFWNITWATVVILILGFTGICANYDSMKNKMILEAVRGATNPITVSCAINLDGLLDKSICVTQFKIN